LIVPVQISSIVMDSTVAQLLEHPALWRAGRLLQQPLANPSGYPALDAHLPGGGWPKTGLAECLLNTAGIGELHLLAPLIRQLSASESRWVVWVDPPFIPYAPALEALGIALERMLIIHTRSHSEALWVLEQSCRSGACSLALAWLDERQLRVQETRRLQFAAQQGRMLTCLFRPMTAAQQQSMAELRLALTPADSGALRVDIRKRRGGWPINDIRLEFDNLQEKPSLGSLFERFMSLRSAETHTADSHSHSSSCDVGNSGLDRALGGGLSTTVGFDQVLLPLPVMH